MLCPAPFTDHSVFKAHHAVLSARISFPGCVVLCDRERPQFAYPSVDTWVASTFGCYERGASISVQDPAFISFELYIGSPGSSVLNFLRTCGIPW